MIHASFKTIRETKWHPRKILQSEATPKKRFTTRTWLLNTKPTLTGMLNEWKQTRPECKVEAIRTLPVIWEGRMREGAVRNARPKEMKDCA